MNRNDSKKKKEATKPSSDLLDLDFGHPQVSQQPPPPTRTAASGNVQLDPWGTPQQQQVTIASNDPWGGSSNTNADSAHSNSRLAANSDPWSPVQQSIATSATGAIPRTSPKVQDLQRNAVDDTPSNPMGSSPANQNKTNQADAFPGLPTNLHLGIN